jgi:predicted O-linked N-acetylglucosamine transferase (SPINDLY family)
LDEAIAQCQRAVAVNPALAAGYSNLGMVYHSSGKLDDAVESFERALALNPNFVAARANLGDTLRAGGKLTDAVAQYQYALALEPDHTETLSNLGGVFKDQGRLDDAVTQYCRALAIRPQFAIAYSNLLFSLMYDDRASKEKLFAAHREWERCYGLPVQLPNWYPNNRSLSRRLKVGYVSGDFRRHSVAYFVEPLLSSHDRAAVEIFCYAEVARPDEVTERFRTRSDHWRTTVGLSDEAVAAQIAEDGIDILVDLAGHTAGNRLPVFAHKPAPVQISWLGYPHPTGLSAIDYRLVDVVTDPTNDVAPEPQGEQLVRFDHPFVCYGPPFDAPSPALAPCRARGTITFGSFNNPTKYSATTIDAWAKVLRLLPDSRLVLKGRPLEDASTRMIYHDRFRARGISSERITLLGGIPEQKMHLAQYAEMDIALDPFPYNGTTTTCEALWMGVPVVTLKGDRHCGRVGASLLAAVGLDDLIAEDVGGYVDIAVRLASDRSRLERLRGCLRATMGGSPLCDGPSFARQVEAAYRAMWRTWCQQNMDKSDFIA